MDASTQQSAPVFRETVTPTPEELTIREVSGLLVIACLFAAAGGYMDAYSYMAHGHVFANSQTGNVVFFAVFASDRQWGQALRRLPPIAAFILGVSVARLSGVQTQKRSFKATLVCQGIEFAVLCGLGLFSARMPDPWVVPVISFVAALQNTSFGAIGPWSFNSVMTTGNISNATSGLVLWAMGQNRAENRGRFLISGAACVAFALGAVGGALYTRVDARHALLPCAAVVLAGLVLTWRQRVKNLRKAVSLQ